MKKLTMLFACAILLAAVSFSTPAPAKASPELVTICYYGVTMQVTPKIAARYVKIGATYGACQ